MKTKIKRVSRSTLAVILAIMMVFSTMLVGTISVNAANRGSNEYNQKYLYVDLSLTTKQLDSINSYWKTDCSEFAASKNSFESLDNRVYKFDLSDIGSYEWLRGFGVKFTDNSTFTLGVDTDESHNCIKSNAAGTEGTWTTYSTGGDKPTDTYTSGKTLVVSYDKSDTWKGIYVFKTDISDHYDMNSYSGVTGLYYYFLDDKIGSKPSASFIVKKSSNTQDWSNQTSDLSVNKGSQTSLYTESEVTDKNNFKQDNLVPYTPLSAKLTTVPENITSGTASSFTVTPGGGVPNFLSGKSTYSANYTLTVKDSSDTQIARTTATNGNTLSFDWTPATAGEQTLTFTLTDDIDTVTFNKKYKVAQGVTKYTVTAGKQTGGTVTVNDGSSATVEENSTVNLVANANPGYKFTGWNKADGITYTDPTSATTTAKVTGNAEVTAIFVADTTQYFYIEGRFSANNNKIEWEKGSTKFPFVSTGTPNLYKYVTDKTPYDLSQTLQCKDYSANQYFFVRGGTATEANGAYYYNNGTKCEFKSDNKSVTLTDFQTDTNDHNEKLVFNDTSTAGPVTIYFNSETKELYYEVPAATPHKITVTQPANGSVSITDKDGNTMSDSDLTSVTSGTKFKVVATPDANYQLSSVSVKNGTTDIKPDSNGVYTMPDADITVTATFVEQGAEEGTATNYWLAYGAVSDPRNWDLSKAIRVYQRTDGTYYASMPSNMITKGSEYYFAFFGQASNASDLKQNMIFWQANSGDVTVVYKNDTDSSYVSKIEQPYGFTPNDGSGSTNINSKFGRYTINSSDVTALEIQMTSLDSKKYVIAPTIKEIQPAPEGAIPIYAKNGTEGKTASYGVTTISGSYNDTDGVKEEDGYKIYKQVPGEVITIQTAVNATQKGYGYYVYAFCVNGSTVMASETSEGSGIYQATYEIPADTDKKGIEITPVYFNKNIENDNNYITFYVDASALVNWGNTVACYTYYGTDNKEGDGAYPGQPMLLNSNGKYFTKIAKYYYENGAITDKKITGLTLNNYSENQNVHKIFLDSNHIKNYQTYDYNDFVKISELGYDTIQFTSKYKTISGTQKTNQNKLVNNDALVNFDTTKLSFNKDDYTFENLKNYDNKDVSILGTEVSDPSDPSKQLYIVSVGNQDTKVNDNRNKNMTTVGQWSTVWYVFDESGKYITRGVPSDFIPAKEGGTNTTAYQDIVKAGYANSLAKITYEYEMDKATSTDSGNSGIRSDGRWLYTKQDDSVTADVIVQYSEDAAREVWTKDTTSYTGSTAYIDEVTTKIFPERNTDAELTANAGKGWVLYDWVVLDSKNNVVKSLGNSSILSVKIDESYHFAARFIPTPTDTLSINHKLYSDANPAPSSGDVKPSGGKAYCYVRVEILDKDGKRVHLYNTTANNIVVDKKYITSDSENTISITLSTNAMGNDKFLSYYTTNTDSNTLATKNYSTMTGANISDDQSSASITKSFEIKKLFSNYALVANTLDFYSDLSSQSSEFQITYIYNTRLHGQQQYVVKGNLTAEQIETMKSDNAKEGVSDTNQLSANFITQNAPFVSNFNEKIVWNINAASIKRYIATVTATQTPSVVHITLSNGDLIEGPYTLQYGTLAMTGSEVTEGAPTASNPNTGDFLFDVTNDPDVANFSYWAIYSDSAMTDTNLIAKCYSKNFNYIVYQDCYIKPVFNDGSIEKNKDEYASLEFLKYSRNQWTDQNGENKTDYLYSDFALSYEYHQNLIQTASNIKTGLAFEVVGTTTDGTYTTDYQTNEENLKTAIKSQTAKKSSYNSGDATRDLYKYEIPVTTLSNKNRIEYYLRFKNSTNVQQNIMKVYAYMIIDNETVILSDAFYMNMYDIATLSYSASTQS